MTSHSQHRASTAVWLCLGYPVLVLAHGLVCVTAWLLIVLIPVAKLSARAASRVLLLPPERVLIWRLKMVGDSGQGEGPTPCSRGDFGVGGDPLVPLQTEVPLEGEVILCCYRAANPYYYKYAVDGINVFAVSILLGAGVGRVGSDPKSHPTSVVSLTGHPRPAATGAGDAGAGLRGQPQPPDRLCRQIHLGPALHHAPLLLHRHGHRQVSGDRGHLVAKWGHPSPADILFLLSSISAQSNFAVGAVVNATFGSITELTFYITALIKGSREGNRCYAEVVKSALTGTLVGCVLFVPVRWVALRAGRVL